MFVISLLASPCLSWDAPNEVDLGRITLRKRGHYRFKVHCGVFKLGLVL